MGNWIVEEPTHTYQNGGDNLQSLMLTAQFEPECVFDLELTELEFIHATANISKIMVWELVKSLLQFHGFSVGFPWIPGC